MNETQEKKIPLVVDMKTRKVGCVLIQAAYGGDNSLVGVLFDTEDWVLAPTDDMKLIGGTLKQWTEHAAWLKLQRQEHTNP